MLPIMIILLSLGFIINFIVLLIRFVKLYKMKLANTLDNNYDVEFQKWIKHFFISMISFLIAKVALDVFS